MLKTQRRRQDMNSYIQSHASLFDQFSTLTSFLTGFIALRQHQVTSVFATERLVIIQTTIRNSLTRKCACVCVYRRVNLKGDQCVSALRFGFVFSACSIWFKRESQAVFLSCRVLSELECCFITHALSRSFTSGKM